jgi:putative endonuclease
MYYVYFAKSIRNSKVYVGKTCKDPSIRVEEHNKGSNSWTKANRPLKLIYFEVYFCKKDADAREIFFKSGIGKRVKYAIVREFDK